MGFLTDTVTLLDDSGRRMQLALEQEGSHFQLVIGRTLADEQMYDPDTAQSWFGDAGTIALDEIVWFLRALAYASSAKLETVQLPDAEEHSCFTDAHEMLSFACDLGGQMFVLYPGLDEPRFVRIRCNLRVRSKSGRFTNSTITELEAPASTVLGFSLRGLNRINDELKLAMPEYTHFAISGLDLSKIAISFVGDESHE